MNLAGLFKSLAEGELSNLAMAEDGDIAVLARPQVLRYANQALTRLYARFVLDEKELLLQQHAEITHYYLLPRFATNYTPTGPDDDEEIRYILDSAEAPFEGGVLKILRVFDEAGTKLHINDDNMPYSVFTPRIDIFQVPIPDDGKVLSLVYQAGHKPLSGDLMQEIMVPDVLLEALNAFIAHKIFSTINSQDASRRAQEHLMIYQDRIGESYDRDLVNSSVSTTNERFTLRGWI